MSLFGAATTGVDPQSGSYLNKEQRIAMFRASQGRGVDGGGGGSRGGSGGKRGGVDPQSSIVVVNKMSGIVQTLQTNFQETSEGINQQVEKNRTDIENLYKLVLDNQKITLDEEKAESKDNRIERENLLRGAREKLVEGLSSAIAFAARGVTTIATKAISPFTGLIGRLIKALGLLAAAWSIDNIDLIEQAIGDWQDNLKNLPELFKNKALETRGVWSVLDNIFSGAKKAVGKIASKVFEVGKWIFKKAASIGKKIFTRIGNFVMDVVGLVTKKIGDLLGAAAKAINNTIRPPKPQLQGPQRPPVQGPQEPPVQGPKGPKPQNWLQKQGDKVKKLFSGGEDATKEMLSSPAKAKAGAEAVEGVVSDKSKTLIQKIFSPLSKLGPKGASAASTLSNSFLGTIGKILKKVPFISSAVDTILNLLAGQQPVEAVIRGLASGSAGAIGWVGGAKLGAGIGALGGSVVPVLGTAVGAGLGGLIGGLVGSMLAGAVGDNLGAGAFEYFTGEKRTENKVTGSGTAEAITSFISQPSGTDTAAAITEKRGEINGTTQTVTGDAHMEQEPGKYQFKVSGTDLSKNLELSGGSSTPAGMDLSKSMGGVDYQVMNLPEVVRDMRQPTQQKDVSNTPGQKVDMFSSSNPDMDIYRAFSFAEYQLVPN